MDMSKLGRPRGPPHIDFKKYAKLTCMYAARIHAMLGGFVINTNEMCT